MQIYLGIHDRKSMYKHSCTLPIESLRIDLEGDVFAQFSLGDLEFISTCIKLLDEVNIVSNINCEIIFNLKDYHFTTYIV